ncbi:MAG TPA: MFS transporter [Coxiellaceae bacterium]|nr:MFS transporter [Coxiellaceae bacterium]
MAMEPLIQPPIATKKISKNVIMLGIVSLFNDFASEMVYPIIPIFLVSFLGVPVSMIGLIEGIAESTSSLLKIFSGWFSDQFGVRKPFLIVGYSFSTVAKLLIGLATGWPMALWGRFIDRFGKGLRSSPRDALITESSQRQYRGRSFGFHQGMDTVGAVLGPLSAVLLLKIFPHNLRIIFFIAFIPGLIGILILLCFVKETTKKIIPKTQQSLWQGLRYLKLNTSFKIFLLISVIFAIGNSSDMFLILKSKSVGMSFAFTILAYALFNFIYALASYPAGMLSDRIGPRRTLCFGFLLFSIVYFLFGMVHTAHWIWILFPLYGVYMAQNDGVSRAYVSVLVPPENTATVFGVYQTAVGVCSFFASLIAGILWSKVSPAAPFVFGSVMSLVAVFLFMGLHFFIDSEQ